MWRGTCSEGAYKGKTALLRKDDRGKFLAQFDDITIPEGFGWHGEFTFDSIEDLDASGGNKKRKNREGEII